MQGASGPAPAWLLKPTQPLIVTGMLGSRMSTQERKVLLDQEGVGGAQQEHFRGPGEAAQEVEAHNCQSGCASTPRSPEQSCEWEVHLAVAIVGEN